MALHTELPIYRTGVRLLDLAVKAQVQMPRTVKRALGEKITQHCVEILDLMALANASQRDVRAGHIDQLLTRQRAITVLLRVSHDARYISPKLWADSIELLDDLDQFAKHRLPAPHYIRYVDDFVLLHHSTQWLNEAKAQIETKLTGLDLQLNPRKTILQPVARGIDFVGHLIKPWHRITRRKTVHTALDRLQDMPAADLHQSANSYFGLLRQATHSHHDRTRVANLMLQRGHVVQGDMTKIYRKKGTTK